MSSAVLGPIYRQLAKQMEAVIKAYESALKKLKDDIAKRLKGQPKDRKRFEDGWDKAKTTKDRLRVAARALGRVIEDIERLGEMAASDLGDAERELWALIDLLRALQNLENLRDYYDRLAKGMGY
jgi:hypothetical protein